MGRNRIFKEVTPKDFVVEVIQNNLDIDLNNVTWKQLYETKQKRKVEIPQKMLNKAKVKHGIYDLTKV